MRTLDEAQDWLRSRLDEGAECPCCKQFAKVYKRPINSQMARWLIWLVLEYKHNQRWIDVKESALRGGDYGKLAHWGLIEQEQNTNPTKRTSGLWRPTAKGTDFVFEAVRVEKKVHLYDGRVMGFSGGLVSIRNALGKQFDYEELMNE